MQDLTLVGLTEDKSKLILVGDSGDEYSLRVDAKLRAALGGDHGRPGRLERKMESALRPRDIQARIRAGESPESVAEAAQTTVDRIMGFASPVLAERAHIAERAQRASLRRRAGDGPARLLGDAVAEHLRGRNADPGTVDWDAWRREDGRWTLVAEFAGAGDSRRGEFVFDATGRYVVAEDDDARWLVGEQGAAPAAAPSPGARRLTAVGTDPQQLGSDALDLVSPTQEEQQRTDGSGADEPTVDLGQHTARFRGRRVTPADPGAASGDADWMATQASDRPAELRRTPTPAADLPAEPEDDSASDDRAPAHDEPPVESEPAEAEQEPAAQESSPSRPARKAGRKKGRASVPSWDEIMFGGGKAE
jgi:hypothetical protein